MKIRKSSKSRMKIKSRRSASTPSLTSCSYSPFDCGRHAYFLAILKWRA